MSAAVEDTVYKCLLRRRLDLSQYHNYADTLRKKSYRDLPTFTNSIDISFMRPTQDNMFHNNQQTSSIPYHQRKTMNDVNDLDVELGMYEGPNTVERPPAYLSEKPAGPRPTPRHHVPEAARISDCSRRKQFLNSEKKSWLKAALLVGLPLISMLLLIGALASSPAARSAVLEIGNHLPWTNKHTALHNTTRDGAVLYEAARVGGSLSLGSQSRHINSIKVSDEDIAAFKDYADDPIQDFPTVTMSEPLDTERSTKEDEKPADSTYLVPLTEKQGTAKWRLPLGMPLPVHKEGDRVLAEKPVVSRQDTTQPQDGTEPYLPPITPLVPVPFQQDPDAIISQITSQILALIKDPSLLANATDGDLTKDLTTYLTLLSQTLNATSEAGEKISVLVGVLGVSEDKNATEGHVIQGLEMIVPEKGHSVGGYKAEFDAEEAKMAGDTFMPLDAEVSHLGRRSITDALQKAVEQLEKMLKAKKKKDDAQKKHDEHDIEKKAKHDAEKKKHEAEEKAKHDAKKAKDDAEKKKHDAEKKAEKKKHDAEKKAKHDAKKAEEKAKHDAKKVEEEAKHDAEKAEQEAKDDADKDKHDAEKKAKHDAEKAEKKAKDDADKAKHGTKK
ncbi:hypothetical protein DOTSEDRAFT_26811 [Dothistroma septosporum NZE10]|uniref:Uncharacterized protein n=1 Tax=Dothistroma septosporum (strain NZE10 / CBS 128990) TaxID=675120 RepID=N1PGD8_DOTSN|nr:hypothetical protein DOTSEDRAFT_26811 [Dothistroma septosporum NZE10]